MKKNLLVLSIFVLIVSLFGCSTKDLDKSTIDNNLPEHFRQIGEVFAKEIRNTVGNLNQMDLNYSDIQYKINLRELFYKDYLVANPMTTKSKNITSLGQLITTAPEVLSARSNNLTNIQLEFITKILTEADNSTSCWNFLDKLVKINQDIHTTVPKIEQERLFYITTLLYYGLKEIYTLEQNGLMPIIFKTYPTIISKSANEGYVDDKWCRKILSAVWIVALEEPTFAGEVIASVTTVVVGGVLLYEYLVCKEQDPDAVSGPNMGTLNACIDLYEKCRTIGSFSMACDDCLARCRVEGIWPVDLCPGITGGPQAQ